MADVWINIGLRVGAAIVGVGLLFVMRAHYRRRAARVAALRAEIAENRVGAQEAREIRRMVQK